jgi:hypothetical protein
MPTCDAYIPADTLPADAEHQMLDRIGELLVWHALRRTLDLANIVDVGASTEPARSIALISVLRHEAYVTNRHAEAPYYKFVVHVPKEQVDDEFHTSITRDITQAVAAAEGGRWLDPEFRVWVVSLEVTDGTKGAGRQVKRVGDVVAHLARLAARHSDEVRAILAAADGGAGNSGERVRLPQPQRSLTRPQRHDHDNSNKHTSSPLS